MGMFDNVKLEHWDAVTGARLDKFQTKSGPCQLLTFTPKELVDYAKKTWGEDGITFYDYYTKNYDDGSFDSYYEEYKYNKDNKEWLHSGYKKHVIPRKPEDGGPIIEYDDDYEFDEWVDEEALWTEKEAFLQEKSDEWDEAYGISKDDFPEYDEHEDYGEDY